jgi:N-acetylmuramoyl-L-alanine amidase
MKAGIIDRTDMVIILDPAHGEETPGKRSPDGKFREYRWSRDVISLIVDMLDEMGFAIASSNASTKEIGLSNRAELANRVQGKRKLLVSLHANAAGSGKDWMKATGFSVYTSKGKTKSDAVAEAIMDGFIKDFPELKVRTDISDGDKDFEEDFTLLVKTKFPAVLIEWMFQDNKEDVKVLMDDDYNNKLARSICDSILKIYEKNII